MSTRATVCAQCLGAMSLALLALLATAAAAGALRTCAPNDVTPLVSIILSNVQQPQLLPTLIERAQRQNYPNLELVIFDDSPGGDKSDSLSLMGSPCVTYRHFSEHLTVGAQRNIAIASARGAYVVFWSENDLYAPNRVELQVQPLIDGVSQVTVIGAGFLYAMSSSSFYDVSKAFPWFPNSIACARSVLLQRTCTFPDSPHVDEDNAFLMCALHSDLQVQTVNSNAAVRVLLKPSAASPYVFRSGGRVHDFSELVESGVVTLTHTSVALVSVGLAVTQADIDFCRAYAALGEAGVLPPSSLAAHGIGLHEDLHDVFELPPDVQLPLSSIPKWYEGNGVWPSHDAAFPAPTLHSRRLERVKQVINRLSSSSGGRRLADLNTGVTGYAAVLAPQCDPNFYFDGTQCVACSVCGAGETENTPCYPTADRTCVVSGESSVGAILTSLLAQMSSARLQSDAAVADLALIYRNDPLLTSFPVPRMTVNQAVMSLKFVVGSARTGPSSQATLATDLQGLVRQSIANFVANNASSVFAFVDRDKAAASVAAAVQALPLISLDNTTLVVSVIRDTVLGQLNSTSGVDMPSAMLEVPVYLSSLFASIDTLRAEDLHELAVLMATPDLQLLESSKISTLQLTFTEQSYAWDHYADANGNILTSLSQSV